MTKQYATGEDRTVERRKPRRARLSTAGLGVALTALMAATVFVPLPDPAPAAVPAAAERQEPIRDTEAEALVAARALQQPVEVLSQRSEYRDVFAQPDGTLTTAEHRELTEYLARKWATVITPSAPRTVTATPASVAAFSTAAQPASTIRSASET